LTFEWYQFDTKGMAMTLRLAEEQDKQLAQVAEHLGISKQQAVALAVERFLELEWQRTVIKSAMARVLERDKELLERLADA
jgi:predicted transcriptional regulator